MSGRGSVKKGKRYERRAAVELRKVFPDAKRGLQYQQRHGAADVEAGPMWVEVKGREVATVSTWLDAEAKRRAAKSKRKVAALVQPSRGTGPVLVTLPLKALVAMLMTAERRGRLFEASVALAPVQTGKK